VKKLSELIRVPKHPWTIGIGVTSATTKDEIEACRSFITSGLAVFRGDCERLVDKAFHGLIFVDSAIVPPDEAGMWGSPNAIIVAFFLESKLRFLKQTERSAIEEKLRQLSFELLDDIRSIWNQRSSFGDSLPDVTFEVERWFFSPIGTRTSRRTSGLAASRVQAQRNNAGAVC
jgi:hypothetical protein